MIVPRLCVHLLPVLDEVKFRVSIWLGLAGTTVCVDAGSAWTAHAMMTLTNMSVRVITEFEHLLPHEQCCKSIKSHN